MSLWKPPYPGEMFRCIVGSTLTGVQVDPSTSDRDERGVFIEQPSAVTGLDKEETITYRTQPEGQASGPGDLDLSVYPLRKFCRFVMAGNPSILEMLFVPPPFRLIDGSAADELRAMLPHMLNRRAGASFLGYLHAQRLRMTGERHGRVKTKRLAIVSNSEQGPPVDEYDYDGKYAAHMVRLGFEGVEFLEAGVITLPLRDDERAYCIAVRKNEVSRTDVLERARQLEMRIADLADQTSLPREPNRSAINEYLHRTYLDAWNAQ